MLLRFEQFQPKPPPPSMNALPPTRMLNREEIREIYQAGEAATIALVEELLEQIKQLEERVEKLENQQHKNSHNSSKPPSADGLSKRTKSLRVKSERPSGGQKGHPGSTLEWSDVIDAVHKHPVKECTQCGQSLADVNVLEWELRQVRDLPPLKLVVHEHQGEVKCCPVCGWINRGEFPIGVNSRVQYGAGVKGLIVYLMEGQLLPSERVCELLKEVFGVQPSEGTLYTTLEQGYEQLEAVEQSLKAGMQTATVGHFDETGMRVNGQLMWLHVACHSGLTYYFIHPKRGRVAMDAMDILPNFKGISVHDGLSSYAHYECQHGLCNAHHLRELLFVVERYKQSWAKAMMKLLVDIKDQVEAAKTAGLTSLSIQQQQDFEQRYEQLIEQGLEANPPPPVAPNAPKRKGRRKQSPPKNLLDRLKKHQSAVLAFMYDFRVPFDNNQDVRRSSVEPRNEIYA